MANRVSDHYFDECLRNATPGGMFIKSEKGSRGDTMNSLSAGMLPKGLLSSHMLSGLLTVREEFVEIMLMPARAVRSLHQQPPPMVFYDARAIFEFLSPVCDVPSPSYLFTEAERLGPDEDAAIERAGFIFCQLRTLAPKPEDEANKPRMISAGALMRGGGLALAKNQATRLERGRDFPNRVEFSCSYGRFVIPCANVVEVERTVRKLGWLIRGGTRGHYYGILDWPKLSKEWGFHGIVPFTELMH